MDAILIVLLAIAYIYKSKSSKVDIVELEEKLNDNFDKDENAFMQLYSKILDQNSV